MANNYLQFSVSVENLSDTEFAWFKEALAWDLFEEQDKAEERGEDPERVPVVDWWDEDREGLGFDHELDASDRSLLLYVEESGNVECAAALLRAFIQAHRPGAVFAIEWAETCSRPRAGEFGGGACVISHDDVQWLSTSAWVAERREAIYAARGDQRE